MTGKWDGGVWTNPDEPPVSVIRNFLALALLHQWWEAPNKFHGLGMPNCIPTTGADSCKHEQWDSHKAAASPLPFRPYAPNP